MKKQLYTKKLLALTIAGVAICLLSLTLTPTPTHAEPTDSVIARQQARLAMNLAAANNNPASKKPTSGAQ
ncbi:MAG: hypothetical protein QM529_07630 [Hydrotalea sp.]|nr:hypothetical protein [Hydrotalea sp.]